MLTSVTHSQNYSPANFSAPLRTEGCGSPEEKHSQGKSGSLSKLHGRHAAKMTNLIRPHHRILRCRSPKHPTWNLKATQIANTNRGKCVLGVLFGAVCRQETIAAWEVVP